ncbi:hypothetical protein EXIGLDRAFT_36140 [Exidia glandulosa HHB12029]|uniref:Uncharacterized protein n=1 Tax=Exidia glandulosa HHB12029 TaxID=1314781 RepID=A0A166MUE8_EXIGL|nr:hypothetical protein EXIGLDRAFT_36140 [Exidia glandulosa HHB12029]
MLCVCDRLQFGNISTVVHRKLHPLLGAQRRLRLALDDHGVRHWGLPAFRELVCDFDMHVEVTAPPLLGHALWNVVYATRVKIIQTRMTKAIEIATFDPPSTNKLCPRHHKAVYSAINSSGPHWEVVARLDDLNVERLSAHDPRCTVAEGFPRSWPAMFGEEEGWMLGAWNTYQSQSRL